MRFARVAPDGFHQQPHDMCPVLVLADLEGVLCPYCMRAIQIMKNGREPCFSGCRPSGHYLAARILCMLVTAAWINEEY